MSATVIVLIIIGLVFIFTSFAFSAGNDRNSQAGEDMLTIPEELNDEQKEKIDKLISDYMSTSVDDRLSEIETKLSEIVNQKTLALGDYAVTVNDEIERNHNEVMFLYSMLSDKQKEIMTTATMVDDYRKEVEAFVNNNGLVQANDSVEQELEEAIKDIDDNILQQEEEGVEPVDSNRDVILEMHKSGLSILEIAKHLGLGVGEVKLVVDLYQGETK